MSQSLYTILRARFDAGVHRDQVVDEILALPPKQLRELMRPIIGQHARSVERAWTRKVERQVFDRPVQLDVDDEPISRIDALRQLVHHTFPLSDGTRVAWLDASAAQHLDRAAWQRDHADRSIADALRHEQAAADIAAAGVTCLRELMENTA